MSSVSLPVTRTTGRALVVGAAPNRVRVLSALGEMGISCAESEEPYGAVAQLSRAPQAYGALVLSLHGVYQEELALIATVKRHFPHVEVWLSDTDGRPAALAEGMRLGADGLLGPGGLHRIAMSATAGPPAESPAESPAAPAPPPAPARVSATALALPPEASPVAAAPCEPAAAPPTPPAKHRGSRRSRAAADQSAPPSVPRAPGESAADDPTAAGRAATRARRPEKPGQTNPRNATGAPGRRQAHEAIDDWDGALGDAVLTAEELRALLHEQPTAPPVTEED